MLAYLAYFEHIWGPLRLLSSYSFLFGLSFFSAACATIFLLPKLLKKLPMDYGKVYVRGGQFYKNIDGIELPYSLSQGNPQGKPTGAGMSMLLISLPLLFIFVPTFNLLDCGLFLMLFFAMLCGYLDDRATSAGHAWSGKKKGFLDLAICIVAAYFVFKLSAGDSNKVTIWLPFVKNTYNLSWQIYLPGASFLLWFSINSTNCSDGVDGLAGSLSFLTLLFMAGLLYVVMGNVNVSAYLLIPASSQTVLMSARWSIALATIAGSLAGYLWWNAAPSMVLMGDAGSRFLGLLIGIGILMTGNPFLIFAFSTIILANGGVGLIRSGILKIDHKLKFDKFFGFNLDKILLVGKLRFPLHDHCRKNLGWSNAQVLMRFLLMQIFLLPLLFLLILKVR